MISIIKWFEGFPSSLAILFSTLIAGFWAWYTICNTRKINRIRATIDIIQKSESEQFYINSYEAFIKVRDEQHSFLSLSVKELSNADWIRHADKQDTVDIFLNHYEFVALGIKNKVLDEGIYKGWMRSTFVKHYTNAAAYIAYLQSGSHPQFFCEYKKLALKWATPEEKAAIDKKLT
ncbi:DUF4760 domain-containing protein [Lacimicrobium alkaliphilum]|uniref:DUF4760 domain-containing protein n=1 Tax=Lacimicrobium alkaliphilum TaxID=1526571 RepID=A0ABQ1R9M2_9ALTE|nr:DUF4760 domain-containing protein [Lacimicrobium alkaliphilum]GGD59558.1 hypothetical protein GCM10011357_13550 [Lacimicrobium alkaliphilum]